MKFKVGDKVKVVCDKPSWGWGSVKRGDTGHVIEKVPSYGEEYLVKFPSQSSWHAKASELELTDFTKKDLKTGMQVRYRNGEAQMVLLDTPRGDLLINSEGWMTLDWYEDDLRLTENRCLDLDIVAVYSPTMAYQMAPSYIDEQELVWEREEIVEVTIEEIARLKGVDASLIRIKEEK